MSLQSRISETVTQQSVRYGVLCMMCLLCTGAVQRWRCLEVI